MREWQSQSHVKWYCRYHVVFTANRKRAIFGSLGTTDCRATHQERTLPVEVLEPIVSSWVKQPYELASPGIDTRDVRTLVRIASIAAQTEICRLPSFRRAAAR